jgi:hypothetical protein
VADNIPAVQVRMPISVSFSDSDSDSSDSHTRGKYVLFVHMLLSPLLLLSQAYVLCRPIIQRGSTCSFIVSGCM